MKRLLIGAVAVLAVVALAALFVSRREDNPIREYLATLAGGSSQQVESVAESEPGDDLTLFKTRPIGNPFTQPPRISYVEIIDLNQDSLLDVVVCDCQEDTVSWLRQSQDGSFEEITLADELVAPARVECVDFDDDDDIDIFVAYLGILMPSNEKIGSLLALQNNGAEEFTPHLLLNEVARVSDVRAADLDSDGDLDLAVTQFGYHQGELRWMENTGPWQFKSHTLKELAGGIHGIVGDINGDSQPDISLLLSQEFEEILVLYGDGKGAFRETSAYAAGNPDFGSSGIWLSDLDSDGDQDILYSNGDAFDYSPPRPWPWHGLQWLENEGKEGFRFHRLVDFGGAVNMKAVDYDGDGDQDIFAASTFNAWDSPDSQSLILLENTDNMRFVSHRLANTPSHIQAMDIGDLNGDGRLDLVTGGMHVSEPYDRVERILLWEGTSPMPTMESKK